MKPKSKAKKNWFEKSFYFSITEGFFVVAIHFDKQELEVQYPLQYEVFFVQYSFSQILPKCTKGNFNVLNPKISLWKRTNIFRPHKDGEIWKRNNQRSFLFCILGKLRQENIMSIATSVFRMFSFFQTKTQSRRFQIRMV